MCTAQIKQEQQRHSDLRQQHQNQDAELQRVAQKRQALRNSPPEMVPAGTGLSPEQVQAMSDKLLNSRESMEDLTGPVLTKLDEGIALRDSAFKEDFLDLIDSCEQCSHIADRCRNLLAQLD